jgi:hypothetical protein
VSNKISISIYPNSEVRAILGRETTGQRVRGCGDEDDPDGDRPESGMAGDSPLDITSKLSGGGLPGFGGVPRPTKFGNNARRTISRCAGVFEVDGLPPDEFLLLTGTIPGGTPESFEAVARWSSWIVKAVKTWISDRGVASAYSIYVWEFQKRGALHIHYCIHCADVQKKVQLMAGWKKKWTEIMDAVSERSGTDVWARKKGGTWATNKAAIQADAQVIRKSVGAYLSKYLSKNAPTNEVKSQESRRFYGPVRWWGVSRPLLKRCSELTEKFTIESISHSAIRYLKEKVFDIMNWSENKVFSYWDKAHSTNVLLTYSPEECQRIYSYLKRDLCKIRTATLPAFMTASETANSLPPSVNSKKQGKGLLRDFPGPTQKATTSPYLQLSWLVTPQTWSAFQSGQSALLA